MDNTLNIIVVGKSGVGKSSFLNYLLGEEIFKTGEGEPVTKDYFDKRTMPANNQGVKYVLYDTKGIEPTTTIECKLKIFEEIDKRDKKKNFFEWIHSVYYCFDSTSSRIEPYEYKLINDLLKKVSVVVLLTKSDRVDAKKIEDLKNEIKNKVSSNNLQIIPINSVKTKGTRKDPTPVEQFGRDEVLKVSFYGLWNKISRVIPNNSIQEIKNLINSIQSYSFLNLENDKKNYLNFSKKYIETEPNIKKLHKIGDRLKKSSNNLSRELFDNVMEFYKKVNSFRPQIFFQTESQNALNRLIEYDIESEIERIKAALYDIDLALTDLYCCYIFNKSEKEGVRKAIRIYQEVVGGIKEKLESMVNTYIYTYKAELEQYGRLCIYGDKKETYDFETLEDLSKDECLYKNMVEYAFASGHCISDDEWKLLDYLRIELKISDTLAGRIYDRVRSNNYANLDS